MTEIEKMPKIIEAINAVLNNGGSCEVKREKKNGVVVVQLDRKIKATEKE